MNINNLFNKTDIECTFSLESYIDSLNNDYDFNDYKIKVSNKTYDELSIESDRLYNEINNLITDYDKYSIEDFKENLVKFWNWIKEMFDRFINFIQVFIKRIIAKVLEITLRFKKKQTIYQNFNNKVFTSVEVNIKDRKLNPKIIDSMDNFINKTNMFSEKLRINNHGMMFRDEEFEEVFNEINNLFGDVNSTDKVKSFINNIFYSEDKKSETTIREYFGCNVGETPKAIIILSENYTKKLIECKNNLEKWLRNLKGIKNELLNFQKTNKDNKVPIEQIKKILSNINYFHNINYSFFIEALKVRKKVAKYISKAILGDKIVEQISAGVAAGKPFKINTYYGMDFEQFIDIPDDEYEFLTEEEDIIRVATNSTFHCLTVMIKYKKNSNLKKQLKAYNMRFQIGGKFPIEQRVKPDHVFLFKEYMNIFKLKIDITKYTTIMMNGPEISSSLIFLKAFADPMKKFEEKYQKIDSVFLFAFANEMYEVKETDKLYHSSFNNNLKNHPGCYRGGYLYPNRRVYFGANIPMTSEGTLLNKKTDRNIYLMKVNAGKIIYRDPEYVHKSNLTQSYLDYNGISEGEKKNFIAALKKEADRTACFLIEDDVELIDVTNQFNPEWIN